MRDKSGSRQSRNIHVGSVCPPAHCLFGLVLVLFSSYYVLQTTLCFFLISCLQLLCCCLMIAFFFFLFCISPVTEASSVDAPECSSSADCPPRVACVNARFAVSAIPLVQTAGMLTWMEHFKQRDPDVLFIVGHLPDQVAFMEALRIVSWAPRAAVSGQLFSGEFSDVFLFLSAFACRACVSFRRLQSSAFVRQFKNFACFLVGFLLDQVAFMEALRIVSWVPRAAVSGASIFL